MIVYIYNIGVDLYNGFNGLCHRINWTYFTVLDGLAHPWQRLASHPVPQYREQGKRFTAKSYSRKGYAAQAHTGY